MKTFIRITTALVCALTLSGCYEDYVKDYGRNTIYCAFQYDLRTFVVEEQPRFDFTVGLAGMLENDRDRNVVVQLDDQLVTGSLPALLGLEKDYSAFTALDGMLGKGKFGTISQNYVTEEIRDLGITALKPLPATHFTVDGLSGMCIRPGRHTDAVTISATDAFLKDPQGIAPYYAIGFRILSADADTLLKAKSFEVIAVKYECKYYGNWYYGGERRIIENGTGALLDIERYPLELPQDDSKIYTLTTTGPYSVKTNKIGQNEGSFELTFDGKDISVKCADPKYSFGYCYTNNAKCIQDRVIYLNYSYDNGNGTSTVVNDYLTFRNRIRDGVNEWQDENPENYE